MTHYLKYYCRECGGTSSPACISASQCIYMIRCSLSLYISLLLKAKRPRHGSSVEPLVTIKFDIWMSYDLHIVFVSTLPFYSTVPLEKNGMKIIFSQPPLISFKRNKNIGNFLVRSAFQTSDPPWTFKCAPSRCKTCPSFHSQRWENIGT